MACCDPLRDEPILSVEFEVFGKVQGEFQWEREDDTLIAYSVNGSKEAGHVPLKVKRVRARCRKLFSTSISAKYWNSN